MKRLLVLSLLVLFLACTNAFAGGSGNPILPIKTTTENVGTGAAFGFNYVGERLLDLNNANQEEGEVKIEQVGQIYGQVPIGISENSNLFFKVGGCAYELEFDVEDTDTQVRVDLGTGIYTGVGMNTLFPLEFGDLPLSWGYELQINGFINNVDSVDRDDVRAELENGSMYGVDGQESLYVAYKYDAEEIWTTFVPYIGAYHSWVVVGVIDDITYKQGKITRVHDIQGAFDVLSFGLLLGLDVDIIKYVNLNVEGRFIGETAITTGATIKF